ncbi:RHS repeat protein [Noviherbaspirillum cavernae]|uniref:RHS repeat protein n=1 Tax=Noviherbaspirillum cavernae TaxID=2320862 RepID=A0A418WYF7_9BURK|nr:DUF6531 domain-containing protein [Noviherbaspirillum cavernae]RJG05284.1 RHS repeat protein [Noviherbaspirillum cavernae]
MNKAEELSLTRRMLYSMNMRKLMINIIRHLVPRYWIRHQQAKFILRSLVAIILIAFAIPSHALTGTIPSGGSKYPLYPGLDISNVCYLLGVGQFATSDIGGVKWDWGLMSAQGDPLSVPGPDWNNAGAICINYPADYETSALYPRPVFRPTPPLCPPGPIFSYDPATPDVCKWTCPGDQVLVGYQCGGSKDEGPPCCEGSSPFPIHGGTGNKYWSDTDYESAANHGLIFRRYYNSRAAGTARVLGAGWSHNYDRIVTAGMKINGVSSVTVSRPGGSTYIFTANGTSYVAQDGDVTDRLIPQTDGTGKVITWEYSVAADGSVETYDAAGKLLSIRNRVDLTQTLTYSDTTTAPAIAPAPGLLLKVTDAYGRMIDFTYDSSGRINKMTDPSGGEYRYAYDADNNLVSVTLPDTKVKGYSYNEAAYTGGNTLPHTLTGVTDENGSRLASYTYDAQGRAYIGQHAGGVDQYQLNFSPDGSSTTTIDPLGTARTYSYTSILGVTRATGQSQPAGAGSAAATRSTTYDSNGNVKSRTDWNGNLTTYDYDLVRNLQTRRTEASGTPQARMITTAWHPTRDVPEKIAEPKRVIMFSYDSLGNMLGKTLQATSDATGVQGFSASVVGTPRTWTYTYNTAGQVLTATGARTDIDDTTTYTYDSHGNLATVTNALQHVTTLSNYDANGRVGRIVDQNGLITDLAYSPRGWLTSKTVGGETTTYDHDGVGQLTKVTLPDDGYISYTYDPAHRLTHVADNLGNSITYTLDAMGNRLKEEVKDAGGTLARQTTRIYDALNRLQQITGGQQ